MSSQQWAGLSQQHSSRKTPGRHRGQKMVGTPFFKVDPVVSLDRIDHPKPKTARRRSRKAPTSSVKENLAPDNTLSVGAEFSTFSTTMATTNEGEKLSVSDVRTEKTSTLTVFGESSVSYASDDQNTQQFLVNAGLSKQGTAAADTVLGQTIKYVSGEDEVAVPDGEDFETGLSLSYSSTLNCKMHGASTMTASGASYVEFSSSLCHLMPGRFVDVPIPDSAAVPPIPEKFPAMAASSSTNLIQPLLTSADNDHEMDQHEGGKPASRSSWPLLSYLLCCLPPLS